MAVNQGTTVSQPLRSTLADDPDMRELISLYIQDLPLRLEGIQTAMAAGNLNEVRRLSHQLRGASAGFGFAPIGLLAAEVEETIKALQERADAMDRVRPLVEKLDALCRRVAA